MSLPSEEQWRPIPDWEGYYEVSDLGRVRGLTRRVPTRAGHFRTYRGVLLVPSYNKVSGYPMVALARANWKKHCFVHQLVALAFFGPRPAGMEVRHLDGDPANSVLSNLTYGTHGENTRDKRRHGTDLNASKTHCLRGHPFDADNTYSRPGWPNRQCRTCANKGARDRRAARKAARLASEPGRAA